MAKDAKNIPLAKVYDKKVSPVVVRLPVTLKNPEHCLESKVNPLFHGCWKIIQICSTQKVH